MNPRSREGVPASKGEPSADDLTSRQRRLVKQIVSTSADRNWLETDGDAQFRAELRHADKTLADREILLNRDLGAAQAKIEQQLNSDVQALDQEYTTTKRSRKEAHEESVERASYDHRILVEKERKRLKDSRWEAQAVAESSEQGAKEHFTGVRKEIADSRGRSDAVWRTLQAALHHMQRNRLMAEATNAAATLTSPETTTLPTLKPAAATGPTTNATGDLATESAADSSAEQSVTAAEEPAEDSPIEMDEAQVNAETEETDYPGRILAKIDDAKLRLDVMKRAWLPKIARGDVVCWPFVAAGLAGIYPLGVSLGWTVGPLVSIGGAIAVGLAFGVWFVHVGTVYVRGFVREISRDLDGAEKLRREYYGRENARFRKSVSDIKRTMFGDVRAAESKYETNRKRIEKEYRAENQERGVRHDDAVYRADASYQKKRQTLADELAQHRESFEKNRQDTMAVYRAQHQERVADIDSRRRTAWDTMLERWTTLLKRGSLEIAGISAQFEQHFPDWGDSVWEHWRPAERSPSAVPFGYTRVGLELTPFGRPADARFASEPSLDAVWPGAIRFPGQSLLIRATGRALDEGNAALQNVMLRLLTGLPPGKVRFTIIDPVGLGQNFAAFMHLADYEESLVHNRIWTETGHIEKCLADLTAQMETVIQKYLRNEFESIADYNEQAGEVAEPYRFVVVANFPVGFSESAARRLVSIVSSGERCGVHALATVDSRQPLPHGINMQDLEQRCANIIWSTPKDKPASWVWKDAEFERSPLELAKPPGDEQATRLLHAVGAMAKEALRVQVPFEIVAPPKEKYWKGDTSVMVSVPLGRAGAIKLQSLELGLGTSQHALIAGRTGSGKSTLLHALVTNLCLIYSPDEIELYLIDFKKGVEFKTYANHKLPHARVIAIESEREFGLSAMQRLDEELKIRGDLYRKLSVQDLNGYRQARAKNQDLPVLPRILLIVDEFQEFFVEDDRIGQESALLMDRLVRQGRAFGIHVHLGSQTLGGAYSLARSTLGQMAIRIALQCSETDAHLILSEDNSAARLLSRPGEAIYNDSNGAVEGNSPFQVVWLPEARRDFYLGEISQLAQTHPHAPRPPAIVFEGNAPALLNSNAALERILGGDWPEPQRVLQAWLGDAIAIKDPTSADFHAHSGSNLLLIGQHPEASLAIFVSAVASLSAQLPRLADPLAAVARVSVLNGMPVDAPSAGVFHRLSEFCPSLRVGGAREVADVLQQLSSILETRTADSSAEYPPMFLFVYDIPRFRALRRSDDDYAFGSSQRDAPADPSKQLLTLLREGPAVGIHTAVWCDTLNNLGRSFDRTTLREFDMRILFQMSGNDSSALIDSPTASRLGFHRALFASEEQGKMEKFRPYGLPEPAWFDKWNDSMQRRKQ